MKLDLAERIAREALKRGAIKLSHKQPFSRGNGHSWPIKINIEALFAEPYDARELVAEGLYSVIADINSLSPINGIAALFNKSQSSATDVYTAATVANRLPADLILIREDQDQKTIRYNLLTADSNQKISSKKLVLLTSVIYHGAGEARVIKAIRKDVSSCNLLVGIFDCNFNIAYDNLNSLVPRAEFDAVFDYNTVLNVALADRIITKHELPAYHSFKSDPFNWYERFSKGEFKNI